MTTWMATSSCLLNPSFAEQLHFNTEGGGKSPVKESPYKKAGFLSEIFLCFASIQDGAA
jgi:hypothetical protein